MSLKVEAEKIHEQMYSTLAFVYSLSLWDMGPRLGSRYDINVELI